MAAAVCSVPLSSLSPHVHSHWPSGLWNLSYSTLYKYVYLRLIAYLAYNFAQVLVLGSVFPSPILWS